MVDSKTRIRVNGTADAGTGTEYTVNLRRVRTTDKLNQVPGFEALLEGTSNTSDIAIGNVVEFYYGTTMSVANRFFKGEIKNIEYQTAERIKLTGFQAGWSKLVDRKHAFRAEYGTDSRQKVYNPISLGTTAVGLTTRLDICNYLKSRNLDGTGATLIAVGTISTSGASVSFFSTDMENRNLMFMRLADMWNVDIYVNHPSGVDTINLTARGSDKSGTHIFRLSGANKNTKLASQVLEEENQYTQVTVIGAGDGITQVAGQHPAGTYSPATPEKELVVMRPDLKTPAQCSAVAQKIHGVVSTQRRRLRFTPNSPTAWLLNTEPGDTVTIADVNIPNLADPFTTKIFEKTFEMDYETGAFELVFQSQNWAVMGNESTFNTEYVTNQSTGSSQYEAVGLNLLRDANSALRMASTNFLGQQGLLGKMAWFSLSGSTGAISLSDEVSYPLRLDNTGTQFRGHLKLQPVSTAPVIDGFGPLEGAFYYDSTLKRLRYFNGSAWTDVGTGVGGGEWTRTAGAPNFLAPTIANDHVRPNGTADLGATTARWANIFGITGSFSGTLTANQLETTLSAIIGTDLTVDGDATLGSSSADNIAINGRITTNIIPDTTSIDIGQNASPTWRDLWLNRNASILGNLSTDGNTILGSASGDTVTFNARIASHLIPDTTLRNLGQVASPTWNDLFLAGSASILGGLTVGGATVLNGTVTLGDVSGDTITFNGRIGSHLIPIDNTRNIGQASSPTWNNITIVGSFDAGGNITADGNLIIDGNTTLGSSSADSITLNGKFASHLLPITTGLNIGQPASPTWNNLTISGALSKGSGSFLIDHPDDPKDFVLRHSFVESPDMLNIYKGKGFLVDGECIVQLPDYFKGLNGSPFTHDDMAFQLTAIGAPAVLYGSWMEKDDTIYLCVKGVNIDGSIVEGPFPFYWAVQAVRHDPYAEINRIIVEEEKAPLMKGKYIYPAAYNDKE